MYWQTLPRALQAPLLLFRTTSPASRWWPGDAISNSQILRDLPKPPRCLNIPGPIALRRESNQPTGPIPQVATFKDLLPTFLANLSAVLLRWALRTRLPLPPGPPRRFFTGNLHQIPRKQRWLQYAEWAKEYGPIITLCSFHKPTVILTSAQAALALLDARSAIYSDRPDAWMTSHLTGRRLAMFQLSSGHARFPRYRRMLQSGLSRRAARAYRGVQETQLRALLKGLGDTPEEFLSLPYAVSGAGATLPEDSLFLAISNILSAFDISKPLDAEGKEIEPQAMNFGCHIVSRSPEMLASLTV
ncbi:cytochrome P450 [Mycena maculata]|uniref:Cytochrome P450 n=1 Tax=Mycena maculata TaxID=230809 RepID=A0AAD7NWF4_9AGAR|nr:cytochrome P450 [Mycena maculata]